MIELVSFNAWIRAVDALIAHRVGLTHQDLPDWLWADHFEDGYSPEEAVDEFFEELTKDREAVDRKIVRITLEHKVAANGVLFNVSVLATARVHGDIVRLERFCGQYMKGEGDNQRLAHTYELVEKLRNQCQDLGLEVRAGVIELS